MIKEQCQDRQCRPETTQDRQGTLEEFAAEDFEAFGISMAVIHLSSKYPCALSTLCSGSFSLLRHVL